MRSHAICQCVLSCIFCPAESLVCAVCTVADEGYGRCLESLYRVFAWKESEKFQAQKWPFLGGLSTVLALRFGESRQATALSALAIHKGTRKSGRAPQIVLAMLLRAVL